MTLYVRLRCRPRVMGHHDDGLVEVAVEGLHQRQDLLGTLMVEVAGRLVGNKDSRIRNDGTGNGDALFLSPGELPWIMLRAVLETNDAQRRHGALTAFAAGKGSQQQRQLDIL